MQKFVKQGSFLLHLYEHVYQLRFYSWRSSQVVIAKIPDELYNPAKQRELFDQIGVKLGIQK